MFTSISLRNALKQTKSYLFYFVTIACAVAIMLGFHSLIFSDMIARVIECFPDMAVLPFSLMLASLLVILILGWLICYMTGYMLKKRSKELGIYMVLGMPVKNIWKMLMLENLIIGLAAAAIGTLFGILLSKLLETILLRLFGVFGGISFGLPFKAMALTLLCFLLIYCFALLWSMRIIKKKALRDLLYYDKENEAAPKKGLPPIFLMFSIILCALGCFLLFCSPIGKGFDVVLSLVCFSLFIYLFYRSISSFLFHFLGKSSVWKYRNNRLIVFRTLSGKTATSGSSLGYLSILFTLAIIFIGVSAASDYVSKKGMESILFDIVLLEKGKKSDLHRYDTLLESMVNITAGHEYPVYRSNHNLLTLIYQDIDKEDTYWLNEEYKYDTVLAYSDYKELCGILGIDCGELAEDEYLIHCIPDFARELEDCLTQLESITVNGHTLRLAGIHTESFNQTVSYGNGQYHTLILPDHAVKKLPVIYSLYSIITESEVDYLELAELVEQTGSLSLLERNTVVVSVSTADRPEEDYIGGTSIWGNTNYLSGKWAYKNTLLPIYSLLISLVYLALIFEVTGAAILSTQIMSDLPRQKWHYHMLTCLGMTPGQVRAQQRKYIRFYFLAPLLPPFTVGCSLTAYFAGFLDISAPFPLYGGPLRILWILLLTLGLFLLLYAVYYAAVTIAYQKALTELQETR